MDILTKNDLIGKMAKKISVQVYSPKPQIDGIQIIELKQHAGEDGTFEEIIRLDNKGMLQQFPSFKLRQMSRSLLLPKAVKAWHIHFKQEDIWYIPPQDHMLLGLWDLRKNSPTKEVQMRIVMGAGISKLVYIPRGVAHGILNLSDKTGTIIYFTNQQFDPQKPDEQRIPWDAAGANFWQPEKR